jgi:hypothetical protein
MRQPRRAANVRRAATGARSAPASVTSQQRVVPAVWQGAHARDRASRRSAALRNERARGSVRLASPVLVRGASRRRAAPYACMLGTGSGRPGNKRCRTRLSAGQWLSVSSAGAAARRRSSSHQRPSGRATWRGIRHRRYVSRLRHRRSVVVRAARSAVIGGKDVRGGRPRRTGWRAHSCRAGLDEPLACPSPRPPRNSGRPPSASPRSHVGWKSRRRCPAGGEPRHDHRQHVRQGATPARGPETTVRRASERAGMPCERVMEAVWLSGRVNKEEER